MSKLLEDIVYPKPKGYKVAPAYESREMFY